MGTSGAPASTAPAASDPAAPPTAARRRTRNIQTLSEEQLRHKRSVDRRAQRAFRQRTKDCIAELEQQLEGSRGLLASREEEMASLQGLNRTMLETLEHIAQLAGAAVLQTRTTISERQPSPRSEPDATDTAANAGEHGISGERSNPDEGASVVCADSHATVSREVISNACPSPASPSRSLSCGLPADEWHRYGGPMVYDTALEVDHARIQTQPDNQQGPSFGRDVATNAVDSPQHDRQGHMLGDSPANPHACATVDTVAPGSVLTPVPSSIHSHRSFASVAPAVFAVMPQHVPPRCPLDHILHDFLNSSRIAIRNGTSPEVAIGPTTPDARALFQHEGVDILAPLSSVMAGVMSTFAHVALAERLAFFHCMCLTMRWQICSDEASYRAMPQWLRPTVTQITVPHERWIDNIPWPQVRDELIEQPDTYPFQVFSDFYSSNVTVNWPFEPQDAVADNGGTKAVHTIFEKHICNLGNWTVRPEFVARFPGLSHACGMK